MIKALFLVIEKQLSAYLYYINKLDLYKSFYLCAGSIAPEAHAHPSHGPTAGMDHNHEVKKSRHIHSFLHKLFNCIHRMTLAIC